MSHDPSEIILISWFGAQETFLIIIINDENSCLLYFVEIFIIKQKTGFFNEQNAKKALHLLKKKAFTVTFNQFNTSFWNKSINYKKKKKKRLTTNFWMVDT